MSEQILIAEDEPVVRANLRQFLQNAGYGVDVAADGEEALNKVFSEDYAIVLTDIRMPKMDGITLLKRILAERPETLVLVTTAYASVDSAIEALRYGAYDYLQKPIEFEDLLQKVNNLSEYTALKQEVVRLRRDLHTRLGFEGIVGKSESMQQVFDLVDKVARTPSTVLITGESGTGKELVARAIHNRSEVADRQFLAVNMAAIPPETAEAQLFGHEKGAYTGADRRREGLLRSVRGGTVFLDEIGELPPLAQAKLLRAIEQREVLPMGADRAAKANFRLVAASNQDLEALVDNGAFRQDLFYRLNVFRIGLPPLRERRDDIPMLVSHFLEQHARALGRRPSTVPNGVMRMLLGYGWPGNVRELSNVIERATILSGGDSIQPNDLPAELHQDSDVPVGLKEAVEEFERRHVTWVLKAAGGNREHAARMLGVDPATLYRRLSKYELT